MDEHDMRAQLNEINLMVKEQPTRDDIKFYSTRRLLTIKILQIQLIR